MERKNITIQHKLSDIYKPIRLFKREIVDDIVEELKLPSKKYLIAGSYRRNMPTCNDIDFVYWGDFDKLKKYLYSLKKFHVYAEGVSKISGIYESKKGNVECDFWITTPETKHTMILYATGSKRFNLFMRGLAKRKGMLLNQYGLYKNKIIIPTKNEKEIFEKLNMKYRTPEQRSLG